jgi:WD40 repeat protein
MTLIRGCRRVLRFARSPFGIAGLVYAAATLGLAACLPYRPAIIIPRPDGESFLIGFSPDGNRLAIARSHLNASSRTEIEALISQPDLYSIWDLSTGRPVRSALTTGVDRRVLFALTVNPTTRPSIWWRFLDDPAWRSLFVDRNPWKAAAGGDDWLEDIMIFGFRESYFSRDGEIVALHSRLRNAGSNVIQWPSNETQFQVPEFLLGVHFLPDGESLMVVTRVSSQDQSGPRYRLSRWNFKTRTESTGIVWNEDFLDDPDDRGHLNSMLISPDGRFLVESPQPSMGPHYGALVRDTTTGEIRFKDPAALWFALADKGRIIVTTRSGALDDPKLQITELETLRSERLVLNGRNGDPVVEVSPNGQLLATAIGQDTSSVLDHWPALYPFVTSIGFEFDSEQREIAVVDVNTCRELISLPHGPSNIYSNGWYMQSIAPLMAFSPDSRRLAVLSDDAVRIWDLSSPRSWRLILSLPLIPALPIALFGMWRRRPSSGFRPKNAAQLDQEFRS